MLTSGSSLRRQRQATTMGPKAHRLRVDRCGMVGQVLITHNRTAVADVNWSLGMPNVNDNSYVHGNHGAPPPPPPQMQHFGQGAPQEYSFRYSNCTGRRKALLIGINYFNQRGQLRGCINDVKNMSTYLNRNFGYAREDMVILTDDQQNPMSQPTKANILRAMHWLVKDAKPNDSLFFHYSGKLALYSQATCRRRYWTYNLKLTDSCAGHGGQTPDLDGDEDDGYDEVIYPVDFRTNGHIVDDEMHDIMVKPLMPGVRLTAIFDSCHSGSALDLPYVYSTQGVLKEPNLAKEAGQGLLSALGAYAKGDISSIMMTAQKLFTQATKGDEAFQKSRMTKTSPADVIMWSGSKDEQTSYVMSLPALFLSFPGLRPFPFSCEFVVGKAADCTSAEQARRANWR